ncbi:MAG: vWA domain-containing protein [Calditrichia bacterium]
MIKDLFLNFSISGWIFFLIFWLLIAIAIFYYHKTLPPLSKSRRIFLTVLRSLVLVIAVFILFEPVLNLVYEFRESPVVAVLLDNSRSMNIKDGNISRADSLQYLLDHQSDYQNTDSLQFDLFTFGSGIRRLNADSMMLDQGQTNISQALSEVADSLSGENLRALVVVSDGQFNQGANPLNAAAEMPVPVYTVALGDSSPPRDVKISGLQANRVAYQGENIPVTVRYMQNGLTEKNAVITLLQDGRQLEAKRVELPPDGFETEVSFDIKAEKPGERRYQVQISVQEGEVTSQNNKRSFLVTVLKSRINALLLSGQPTFDQRILIYALQQLPDVNLQVRTQRAAGRYLEGSLQSIKMDSVDVLLLLGYPTQRSSQGDLQKLREIIQQRKVPLFLFLTRFTDLAALNSWQDFLPFEKNSRIVGEEPVIVRLTTGGSLHPATRLEESPQQNRTLWQDLPPVSGLGQQIRLKEGSYLLLQGGGKDEPVLAAAVQSDIKSLLMAAAAFDSWHLQLQDDPLRDNFFRLFVERSIKWLVNREDLQRVQIRPAQEVYRMGESIHFSGQVLNDFYQPLNDAEVDIRITGDNFEQQDVLVNQNGNYQYKLTGLSPGEYQYTITARKGERVIGTGKGKIVIQDLELEMQETRANITLMRELARRSGGELWSVNEYLKKNRDFGFNRRVQLLSVEHVLWNKIYWLILLILFLALEWFFRKRWGLL